MPSDDYKNGYGQGKADSVKKVKDMIAYIEDSIRLPMMPGTPSKEKAKELREKAASLRWVLTLLKDTK